MAQLDKREAILARLAVLLATVDGVRTVYRNRIDIPESKRPAVVILDADELVDPAFEMEAARGRPPAVGVSPVVITMTPEIYLLDAARPADVGTALNAFRNKVIRAILQDETLIGYCKDGDISYQGFSTGLAAGRRMEGEAGISFGFRYMLFPSKL